MARTESDLEHWKEHWNLPDSKNPPWQFPEPHEFSQKGYRVVGVELSEEGAKRFFQDNELDWTKQKIDKFTVYKNLDRKIEIYSGDFFSITNETFSAGFDVIWDRNAFVAINENERKRYVSVLSALTKSQGTIFLSLYDYDPRKHLEAPHPFTIDMINEYFGEYFKVLVSDTRDAMEIMGDKKWKTSLDWLNEHFVVLTKKDKNCE